MGFSCRVCGGRKTHGNVAVNAAGLQTCMTQQHRMASLRRKPPQKTQIFRKNCRVHIHAGMHFCVDVCAWAATHKNNPTFFHWSINRKDTPLLFVLIGIVKNHYQKTFSPPLPVYWIVLFTIKNKDKVTLRLPQRNNICEDKRKKTTQLLSLHWSFWNVCCQMNAKAGLRPIPYLYLAIGAFRCEQFSLLSNQQEQQQWRKILAMRRPDEVFLNRTPLLLFHALRS